MELYDVNTLTFQMMNSTNLSDFTFSQSGDNGFCSGGSFHSGDSGLVFSIGSQVEIYCPPRKRSRISGPCIVGGDLFEDKSTSIDVLPDECLFEIFTRLAGAREQSSSACVSKRWLTILSGIRSSEFGQSTKTCDSQQDTMNINGDGNNSEDVSEVECDGFLTRCVEGKKATDVRLAAIAIGTSGRGGLGKLSIRGSNTGRGVSNHGLSAIAHGCPSLRVLSLWNIPLIDDEGLCEIARECHTLEKLDLCECPSISDKGLVVIAQANLNLTSLTVESCPGIGDESLQAISEHCPKLQSVTIRNCPYVGDQGIASLLSASKVLSKLNLQSLSITDCSVAVIGHYGKAITKLILCGLQNVSQKGFWVMGNALGLRSLSSLSITSCRGITDLSFEALGKGCPNLKHMCLRKCLFLSDNGLVAFGKAVNALDSLQLEECSRITQTGILNALSSSSSKLKSLSLVKCMGIKDLSMEFPILSPCETLRSLSIRSCPGFGSNSLAKIGKLCPKLHHLHLMGLHGITDASLVSFLEGCGTSLAKVSLSECLNLTDEVILALARLHGETLELLNLDGCREITDSSLATLAASCPLLNDLDVSKCSITDSGVVALSHGMQSNLQVLSLSGCLMISNSIRPALEKLGRTLVGLNLKHCNSISNSTIELLSGNLWMCDILS